MIRVREIELVRQSDGFRRSIRVELDIESQCVQSEVKSSNGSSRGCVSFPGGLTGDVNEFSLAEIADDTARKAIDEAVAIGCVVIDDDTVDHPDGAPAPEFWR